MKAYNICKAISISAYCVIIIQGSMIGIPLIFVLILDIISAHFLKTTTACLAMLGLITLIFSSSSKQSKKTFFIKILPLFFLMLPIVNRIIVFEKVYFFNIYFIIPFIIFIVFYFLYIKNCTLKNII